MNHQYRYRFTKTNLGSTSKLKKNVQQQNQYTQMETIPDTDNATKVLFF
jgi:hypothetical protein